MRTMTSEHGSIFQKQPKTVMLIFALIAAFIVVAILTPEGDDGRFRRACETGLEAPPFNKIWIAEICAKEGLISETRLSELRGRLN